MEETKLVADYEAIGADQLVTRLLGRRRKDIVDALDALLVEPSPVVEGARLLVETLRGGRKVLVAGNGGSAAMAQHLAAELVGRFKLDRAPYAAMALTVDTSILTAVANDYGYVEVFDRQVHGLGQAGDLLVVLSTSGESENLVQAAAAARVRNMKVMAVVGSAPCRLDELADVVIGISTSDTPVIQELHLVMIHILCEIAEAELSGAI